MNKSIVAAILLVFIFACKEEKKSQKTTEASKMGPLSVEALVVQPSSVSDVIEVAGNILPFELTEIRPEISGRIVDQPLLAHDRQFHV